LIDGAAKSLSEDFFKKFELETAKIFSTSQDAASGLLEPQGVDQANASPAGWLSTRNVSLAALALIVLYFVLR
jgi:hypothetical protein